VDGQRMEAGGSIASLSGHLVHVLAVERSVLNLLQLLCGVATHTARFVDAVEGTGARVVHTRKTIPNMRMLQQQAVLDGGGYAHRYNLSHAAMFKDNLLHAAGLSFKELADLVRTRLPHTAKLEIECDHVEQVPLALEAGADVIMLDNMNLDEIRSATAIISGRAVVEVSGGITIENIRAYADAGANILSTSQVTMNAPAIDIGLDIL
jgi:nicotinate-nucleotide pyrophosphorylase (carboxylating)